MSKRHVWVLLFLVVVGMLARFGTAAEEPAEGLAPKPAASKDDADAAAGDKDDAVAKVDDVVVRRSELIEERRQIAINNPRVRIPNNDVILDRLINRVLLQRYISKESLAPSGAEVQKAIRTFDARLRQRGASYEKYLEQTGLSAESHAGRIRYEMSMRKLIERIAGKVTEEQVRAEFDAHPESYDGSRVRISQIFVDTSNISHDAKKIEEAKQKIDKCYADLQAGKEFKHVASDHSEGPAAARGGDRGWFTRKASEADEELLSNAWKLEVNKYTEPVRGSRGWHILIVADREPAHFTYFGAKRQVKQALTRNQLEGILDELKGKAKIEKKL